MNSSLNNGTAAVVNPPLTPKQNFAFLGSPPLVPGEDTRGYEQLLAFVTNTVKPVDIVDVILIRDFVDEEWEILRYRRATANLINTAKANIEETWTICESSELTEDAVIAQAVSLKLGDIERLDRMIMTKEIRRDNALREADRHQANFGARLRRAAEKVEDVDYRVIKEKPAEEQQAS